MDSSLTVPAPIASRLQRITTLILTVGPLTGFVVAVISLWGWGLGWSDVVLFAGFYVFSGLGITVGFHRYFTHGSFEAKQGLRLLLAIAGSFALEGSLISWVANHRQHHAFSDREGDPHSPHLEDKKTLKRLWHAHMGWLFKPQQDLPERWAPKMLKDPALVRIDSLFPLWVVLSLSLPALLGGLISWSWQGALTAFLWAGLARICLLHHMTWSINSICHFFGKRPFAVSDYSANNWLLSWLTFGEAWHNNHHAFPWSAWHGLRWWQFDSSGWVIAVFERLGLAYNIKRPSEDHMAKKLVDNGSGNNRGRSSLRLKNGIVKVITTSQLENLGGGYCVQPVRSNL